MLFSEIAPGDDRGATDETPAAGADPAAAAPEVPPAQWSNDPLRRHDLRYWDGVAEKGHVSTNGVTDWDPI